MADISQVKEITAKLEQGVKDIFNSDTYADYLKTMSRFHRYSTRNTILIHMQRPNASLVAGFRSWQTKFGRNVKKGEKAIKILAPAPFTVREEKEKVDPDTKMPVLDDNGIPIVELTERQFARFKVTSVFDVLQTDGKPLPLLVQDLTGNVEQYTAFMDALRFVSPLPIVFEPLPSDTDGTCHFGDRISIREGMSEIQTVCAVIHEITHANLHDLSLIIVEDENAKPKDRRTEEVEAESVAYSVCAYFNIETGANSFGYLADWSKTRDLKELNASLDIIRKTASDMINAIEGRFQEIAKDRDITFAIGEEQMTLAEESALSESFAAASQPKAEPTIAEQTAAMPEPHPLVAEYARATHGLLIGANVNLIPVFIDGNFNRENKRIRVKVEETSGKYQIFSREEHGDTAMYFMTASGRIDRTSQYFDREWDEQQRKWVNHHPTEAELDAVIPQIAAQFESDMANPEKWASYQHAAVVNRLDDCESHNVPVRAAQQERRQAEAKEREERERAIRQGHQDSFNASVDELADTLVKNEKAVVEVDHYLDKNPLFTLFDRYEVDLPLATKGWVNRNLRAVQVKPDGTVSVWMKKDATASKAFCQAVLKLTAAIATDRAVRDTNTAVKERTMDTIENKLYAKFAEMFPQVISGEYSYMRLESGGFEPLSLEWIGGDRISVMHTYTMNGDLMYDPMMTFEVDREAKTMTAAEYQMSMPPLYQRVDKDGSGISVDGNGREQQHRDLRMSLDGFASDWFGNISQQGFMPVRANMEIDGEETQIIFDKDGNPILPEPPKVVTDTLEHSLYEKFSKMFPEFMNGEYSTLRLEAQYAKPLVLEWVFGDWVSIAHVYEKDGEPAYEPMVMLTVNSSEKTMTAQSFDTTDPPRNDVVKRNDDPPDLAMQQNINNFTSQWLDRAVKQRFRPIEATLRNDGKIDTKTVTVTFDITGKPIIPEHQPGYENWSEPPTAEDLAQPSIPSDDISAYLPEKPDKTYDLGYGHMGNGLTVWNRAEERNGDYVTVAHIDPDRTVKFYDKDMPDNVKANIEHIARTSDARVSSTQDQRVFRTPPTPDAPEIEQSESYEVTVFTYEDGGYDALADVFDNQPDAEAFARLLIEDGYYAVGLKVVSDGEEYPITISMPIEEARMNAAAVERFNKIKEEADTPAEPKAVIDTLSPDPSIGLSEMNLYGYAGDGVMLPLLKDRALELFDADHAIYLLYPDNTEAMAFDRDEILKHDGIYGIERGDWERTPEYAAMKAEVETAEGSREADLLYGDANKIGIYQLKSGDETRDYRFEPLDRLHSRGLEVSRNNYELVYTAPLSDKETLDAIYERFNINRPVDFTGHSLSVSDIIVFQRDGNVSSHYVNDVGFVGLFDFLGEEKRQTQAVAPPAHSFSQVGKTPTVAELEADAKAGKTISLSDLSRAVNAERGSQPAAPKPKLTLAERLEKNKQKAAAHGQPDPSKSTNREV